MYAEHDEILSVMLLTFCPKGFLHGRFKYRLNTYLRKRAYGGK